MLMFSPEAAYIKINLIKIDDFKIAEINKYYFDK
jgi:hypothetical protein